LQCYCACSSHYRAILLALEPRAKTTHTRICWYAYETS
jgi:hypothetical protein